MSDDAFEYIMRLGFPKRLLKKLQSAADAAGIRVEQLIVALLWLWVDPEEPAGMEGDCTT